LEEETAAEITQEVYEEIVEALSQRFYDYELLNGRVRTKEFKEEVVTLLIEMFEEWGVGS